MDSTASLSRWWPELYTNWIQACEQKAMSRALHEAPVTFSWGFESLHEWRPGEAHEFRGPLEQLCEWSRRVIQNSEDFFSYAVPTDFNRTGRLLRFTSPACSPWSENNTVSAAWYPARHADGRAVLLLPHWNASPASYVRFCRFLNLFGLSALVMALPCHGRRKPATARAAEYVVSANIGRTIACARQAVVDARSCVDWLEQQRYTRVALVGTSLGSGYGFLTSAHEPRLEVNVFNQCSSTISDVVWNGLPGVRRQLEAHLSQNALREAWSSINAVSYFDQFARHSKASLLVCGRYDRVFPRDCTREVIDAFRAHALTHRVVELPCGHYTMGWPPYCVAAALRIATFLHDHL
jgi:pimeloyl-ACP methyl ester carboxylesterase